MDLNSFRLSAEFIAKRNTLSNVTRVLVSYDDHENLLRVIYCTKCTPTDEDWEECELTCAELIAEFPEIRLAETDCIMETELVSADEHIVVYSKL